MKKHVKLKDIILLLVAVIIVLSLNNILQIFLGSSIPLAVVSSYSMDPTLHVTDIVVSLMPSRNNYAVGDIIIFKNPLGELIVHRVIKKCLNPPVYVTQGDANPIPDTYQIRSSDIYGKVIVVIPYLGTLSLLYNKYPFVIITYILLIALISLLDEKLLNR